jgi:transcriptional regulator with XRE-family HTH domain
MNTITGRQIRAGRALLEWSREDLAEKAGLTVTTVSNIESDARQPQEKTLASIARVFDQHGVEFLDDEGVRIRKKQARFFTGKVGYKQFLDHIYDTVKDGGRIRQFNVNDGKNLSYADDYAAVHMERMSKIANLDAQVLTLEGDTNFPARYCTYRWLDKSNKLSIPYYVYNDFLAQAIYKSDHNIEVISIHSRLLSDRYVEQFERFWNTAINPSGKRRGK